MGRNGIQLKIDDFSNLLGAFKRLTAVHDRSMGDGFYQMMVKGTQNIQKLYNSCKIIGAWTGTELISIFRDAQVVARHRRFHSWNTANATDLSALAGQGPKFEVSGSPKTRNTGRIFKGMFLDHLSRIPKRDASSCHAMNIEDLLYSYRMLRYTDVGNINLRLLNWSYKLVALCCFGALWSVFFGTCFWKTFIDGWIFVVHLSKLLIFFHTDSWYLHPKICQFFPASLVQCFLTFATSPWQPNPWCRCRPGSRTISPWLQHGFRAQFQLFEHVDVFGWKNLTHENKWKTTATLENNENCFLFV